MIIWPMGCKKIESDEQLEKILKDDNYIGQKKIKGVRAVMHVLPDGSLRFTTRGSSLDNPDEPIDITHRLSHLTKYKLKGMGGLIIDCEMWHPEMDDSEIAGKLNYKSTVTVPQGIQPYSFDVVSWRGQMFDRMPLHRRLHYLYALSQGMTDVPWFHSVDYVTGEEEKRRYLYELLEAGEEGMVFKNISSRYNYTDKKSKKVGTWYKYKKKDTVDAVVTGSTPPERYYRDSETGIYDLSRPTKPWAEGWFGSLNFEFYDPDGQKFTGSCSGMTDAMKAKLSNGNHSVKPEYIGRTIEVEFFERNKYGNCEHPRFIRLREELEK